MAKQVPVIKDGVPHVFATDGKGGLTGTLIPQEQEERNAQLSTNLNSIFSFPSAASLPKQPNLTETMDAIKSGAIFKDISASLGKVAETAGALPGELSGQLAAKQSEIAAAMEAAKADLPKQMAIAQANIDLVVKKTLATTGKPPTEEQIAAASGPLAIFSEGPKLLKSMAENISKGVASFGSIFGGPTVPVDLPTADLNKATGFAQQVGSKVSEFFGSVPSQTIPDPNNPGETIPNPAFAAFSSIPENATKLGGLDSLTGKLGELTGDLGSKFSELTGKASAATSSAIEELKAFSFASSLAEPASGLMGQIRSLTIDTSKVSELNIKKVMNQALSVELPGPPAIPSAFGGIPPIKDVFARVEAKEPKDESGLPALTADELELYRSKKWQPLKDKSDEITPVMVENEIEKLYPGWKKRQEEANVIKFWKKDTATDQEKALVEQVDRERDDALDKSPQIATWNKAVEDFQSADAILRELTSAFFANRAKVNLSDKLKQALLEVGVTIPT